MSELYVDTVRETTLARMEKLRADLKAADEIVAGKACVYATGSFGRLEAGEHSDLDVFIVVEEREVEPNRFKPALDGIDEIRLKHHLIQLVEKNGIAKFDAGGKFLASHSVASFTEWLGSNEDDYRNTLTARMLMLLESKCLVGQHTYDLAVKEVTKKYFRDFDGHESDFVPAFLLNDVLRMWRTFCVNYEFSRKGESREKIKNLKLKFSRMITCYSAVIFLLSIYAKNRTVTPADIVVMVSCSPTERIESIATEQFWGTERVPEQLVALTKTALSLYSDFLSLTHQPLKKAVQLYTSDEVAWRAKSYDFGAGIADMIDLLGQTSDHAAKLRRLIIT